MKFNKILIAQLFLLPFYMTVYAAHSCEKLICETIHFQEEIAELCTINLLETETEWFILTNNAFHEKIEPAPAVSMSQISELKASPTEKFLAVLSVGEGHPFVDIVDLAALLQKQPAKVFHSINPYPGTINIVEWIKEDVLIVEIDDFLDDSEKSRCKTKQFSVTVPSGEMTCIAKAS